MMISVPHRHRAFKAQLHGCMYLFEKRVCESFSREAPEAIVHVTLVPLRTEGTQHKTRFNMRADHTRKDSDILKSPEQKGGSALFQSTRLPR
jgi:hypothetical protein